MKILVTGAGGQVGTALQARAPAHGLDIIALDRQALDITDASAVAAAVRDNRPDLVINAAAYTAVDKAEAETEKAFAINADGAEYLAQAAKAAAIPLLHISTDFVFDGRKTGAYVETDAIAPLNVYGASKAAGEARIAATLEKHIILRTAWVFGGVQNFVNTMLRLGETHKELSIVDDQRGGPTASHDIADTLLRIAKQVQAPGFDDFGLYHYCGAPAVTWFGFAEAIFRGRETPKLTPIPTESYPVPATRPKNSVLDCSRIKRVFDIDQPDWQAALSRILDQQ
ncbi:MAG: dTDP-4-dehydrorhamnose reductase [Sneathiella sp.]|jgi:dTDP-4-dehydrorhamnose reductase|uniref:dTDP-4-dehydrorhamnose reductase n=1 Tax=Sneathiella sp. TaxID=1964365 RepID=UPI000C60F36E|nr:dTDP-4-dehydrorhamnose reductase [Sneathiella sp.]MAL78040.1 dTDP-4-dehydrorhamnose reductase [Sneathiella sp.]